MSNRTTSFYLGLSFFLCVLLAVLSASFVKISGPLPQVEAQGFAPASKTFTVPSFLSGNQYIPACTISQNGCINNIKAVSHSVVEQLSAVPSGECASELDFSSDNVKYFSFAGGITTLAASTAAATYTGNGYYNYVRVKLWPCSVTQTITYTGYSVSQPIAPISQFRSVNFTTAAALVAGPQTIPLVMQSFQCLNTNASTAFLQLLLNSSPTPPTLGSASDFLDIAIPTGLYSYPGSNFTFASLSQSSVYSYFWAGASTTLAGATGVTDPVYCTFQYNVSGPFFPFNPPSL